MKISENSSLKKVLFILALGLILSVNSIFAAGLTPEQELTLRNSEYNSGSTLMQRIKKLQDYRLNSELERLKDGAEKDEKKEVRQETPDVPELTIKLQKLEIPDSEVLSKEEIESVTSKYIDKTVSIKDLYDAVNEINYLYAKKGYLTTRAILPPQKIDGNVVKIMLVEGKIGSVYVENNDKTKTSYIKRFLKVPEGVIPNMNSLKNNIQRFNSTNRVTLQIKMVAGEKPMTTDFYIIAVEPEKSRTATIFSDNSGGKSSGEWRGGLSVTDSNLTGNCDIANITSMFSKTSETVLFSYNMPIGYKGIRMALNHSQNHMRSYKGEMSMLDVRGISKNTGISFTIPCVTTPNNRQELTLEFQDQSSETDILGNNFVDDKEKRYSLSYSAMRIKNNTIFMWKPTYVYNSHKNIDGQSHYGDRLTIDAIAQRYKKNGDLITLKVSAQKDLSDYIPSADQYYLGGQYSVRGYHENVIGGDAGVNAKLDYSWHTKTKGLNFVTFFDWGRLSGDTILTTKEIYSCGWGFEYQKKNLAASVYTGYALKKKIGDSKDIESSITHFSISYLFD